MKRLTLIVITLLFFKVLFFIFSLKLHLSLFYSIVLFLLLLFFYKTKKFFKSFDFKKILLVFFGILLAFIFIEIGLHVAGAVFSFVVEQNDYISSDASYDLTILILGESTSAGGLSYGGWPYKVGKMIENETGLRLRVINKAVPGTVTSNLHYRLYSHIHNYNPDIIISMMGINDGGGYEYYSGDGLKEQQSFLLGNVKSFRLFSILFEGVNALIYRRYEDFEFESYRTKDLYQRIIDYIYDKDYYSAYELFNQSIKLDLDSKDKSFIYSSSAGFFFTPGFNFIEHTPSNFEKFENYLKLAIDLNPNNFVAFYDLSRLYSSWGRCDLAFEYLEKIIRFFGHDTQIAETVPNLQLHMFNAGCSRNLNYQLDNVDQMHYGTRHNYVKMFSLMKENNIKYFAMQYPNRDVNYIKNFFEPEDQEKITFISNANFSTSDDYDLYFYDSFATYNFFGGYDRFGHTTDLGYEKIAENVKNHLLEYFYKQGILD